MEIAADRQDHELERLLERVLRSSRFLSRCSDPISLMLWCACDYIRFTMLKSPTACSN